MMDVDSDESKNYEFVEALKKHDIDAVRELLQQGAEICEEIEEKAWENKENLYEFVMGKWQDVEKNIVERRKEIIKLILSSKTWDSSLIEYMCLSKDRQMATTEHVKYVIEHEVENKKMNTIIEIFHDLINFRQHGPLELEILELLFDCGLPIDDYVKDSSYLTDRDLNTPIQCCIWKNSYNFVEYLVNRGADIYKRTKLGRSCMFLAAFRDEEDMIELFIKKGVPVEETSFNGQTVFHAACHTLNPLCPNVLIEHNANANALDARGLPPIVYTVNSTVRELMVRLLAYMRFESQFICDVNLKYIKRKGLEKLFKDCLGELKKMKAFKFYNSYSLFDVLKMRTNRKKLTLLAKNDDFVAAFKSGWDREAFKNYAFDLDWTIEFAEERKNKLITEEEKLFSIFKDIFPELIIRKIAFFIKCGDVYF